ncbi:hypothetical protein OE88DRAFT_1163454 [Heliocybe sulcata]|uniref:NAD(P)-binding protein n=1 Tax=Heliocybe sulcata TaxID=5364 RepID=A0A5C3NA52_9AGAM|nr:hypothetical protein OE88DRAFT_1163454 [Heliocybe sulcata]
MNAGVGNMQYEEMEGWESTLHVNHLSTALCALLLLSRMLKTSSDFSVQTRLVVVSSAVHYSVAITEDVANSPSILKKLNDKEYFQVGTGVQAYMISKLLNIFFVRALTARLTPSSPLITTAVNPGFCDSELRRNYTDFTPPSIVHEGKKIELVAWTSEEGARQLVFAALGPVDPAEVDSIRGAYISENAILEPSDFVISKEGKECEDRIWDETIEILSETMPKVTEIIKQYLTV